MRKEIKRITKSSVHLDWERQTPRWLPFHNVQLPLSKHKPAWTIRRETAWILYNQLEKSNFNDTEKLLQYVTEMALSGAKGEWSRWWELNAVISVFTSQTWGFGQGFGGVPGRRAFGVGGLCEVSICHVQLQQNVQHNTGVLQGPKMAAIVILSITKLNSNK